MRISPNKMDRDQYNWDIGHFRERARKKDNYLEDEYANDLFPEDNVRYNALMDNLGRTGSEEYWGDLLKDLVGHDKDMTLNEFAKLVGLELIGYIEKTVSEGWVEELLYWMLTNVDYNELGIATVAYWCEHPPEALDGIIQNLVWDDEYDDWEY